MRSMVVRDEKRWLSCSWLESIWFVDALIDVYCRSAVARKAI
jgi:hypothetical protein